MAATLALVSMLVGLQSPMDRYALAERLKRVEVAWMNASVPLRREAISDISGAVTGFFSGQSGAAARALDTAWAKLERRSPRASDALMIRVAKPLSESGQPVTLDLRWSYLPTGTTPVRLAVGPRRLTVKPGQNATFEVSPYEVNPDLRLTPEIGYLLPVRVNDDFRLVYVSYVRNVEARLTKLAASSTPAAKEVGGYLKEVMAEPTRLEADLPLIQYLFAAEALDEGRQKVADQEQVYRARFDNTVLRAQFPRYLRGRTDLSVDVVIAVHGAGGSENMFFEAYGRGLAVSEAMRRGWAFIAPRAGAKSVSDALSWLREERKLRPRRVFLMGHSMGGGVVLSYNGDKPTAAAAFAPAANRMSPTLAETPLYLAVGKQEMDMLLSGSRALAKTREGKPDFEYREVDASEHLMIVADAVSEAYKFFDRYAR